MTVIEAADWLRKRLLNSGFEFARPNPLLAWDVFKRFATDPVESAGGRECEELWFEASDGDPIQGFPGLFDFVRQFLQDTERGAEYHEQITAHFTCEPNERLDFRQVLLSADLSDFPEFFKTVEGSEQFRAGIAFSRWSFEVRVDVC